MEYKNYQYSGVSFIKATNSKGLSIIFCPVGASIKSISLNGEELLLTPKSAVDFLNKENKLGKTLGPVLNGEDIIIGGQKYEFDKKWQTSMFLFNTKPLFEKNYFYVQYVFHKKKNEDGLPGNVQYLISYSLNDSSNELLVDYRVMSDKDTPIRLTNELPFLIEKEEQIIESQIINIENEKYKIEVSSAGFDYFDIHKVTHNNIEGVSLSPKNKKAEIVNSLKPYHKQILYKFIIK